MGVYYTPFAVVGDGQMAFQAGEAENDFFPAFFRSNPDEKGIGERQDLIGGGGHGAVRYERV